MITQAEIDNEISKLKWLIEILARRGYILKSELLGLLPACRATHMTIEGLEDIMYSVIDETVEYRNDVISTDSYKSCTELQDELKKQGHRDLFDYLRLQNNATIQMVEQAVRAHMQSARQNELTLLQIILGVIIAKQLLEIYRDFMAMEGIFAELDLRREFGIEKISQEEMQEYERIAEAEKGVTKENAKALLAEGAQEKGLRVEKPEHQMEKQSEKTTQQEKNEEQGKDKEEELDEFLIPVRDTEKERENQRGHNYGISR